MTFRYQEFTSPGTWTNPGSITQVQVTVVGGGGGGCRVPGIANYGSGGGGGAVRTSWVPVSGPVPVTVGAGGTGGSSFPAATNGGVSCFGPLGPGPVPTIPAGTFAAGGGAKGGSSIPAPDYPIGGGAGAPNSSNDELYGGAYGQDSAMRGSGAGAGGIGAFRLNDARIQDVSISIGEGYYGNGGNDQTEGVLVYGVPYPPHPNINTPPTSILNTGAGGGSTASPAPNSTGSPGSAGIVIVRWFE